MYRLILSQTLSLWPKAKRPNSLVSNCTNAYGLRRRRM